jgi:hypothetical protein
MLTLRKTISAFALATLSVPVWAADPVTDAMQYAYAPYRVALFKTNSNAPAEALAAVTEAQKSWAALRERFAAKPPAPYDRDTQFSESLAQVDAVYRKAWQEVTNNQLAAAHETLEEARDVMAELRKRNNVTVFSDAMNAYHAQMERVLQDGPAVLGSTGTRAPLVASVGALNYLAQQLTSNAPAPLTSNTEFQQALQAVLVSVNTLQKALWSQDDGAAKEALSKLKAPYSKFFLKFG